MSNLRNKLIRLAHEKPELRPQLLPLLQKQASPAAFKTLLESSVSKEDIEKLIHKAGYKIVPDTFEFGPVREDTRSRGGNLWISFKAQDAEYEDDFVTGAVTMLIDNYTYGIRVHAEVKVDK